MEMASGERVLGSTWGRSGSAGGGWVPRHTRRAVASRVERWLWLSPPNAPQARVHARAAAGLSSCHAPVHCCVSPGSSCPCCLLLWSGRPAAARYRRRAAGAAAGVGARVVTVAGPLTIPGKQQQAVLLRQLLQRRVQARHPTARSGCRKCSACQWPPRKGLPGRGAGPGLPLGSGCHSPPAVRLSKR